jgi:predicted acyl esterase
MKVRLLLSLLLMVASISQAQDTLPIYRKLTEIAVIDQKVMISMRDGVRLATDIYRPKGGGRHPLILSRTPYNFNNWVDGKMTARSFQEAYEAVSRGYAFAVQSERGRFFLKVNGISLVRQSQMVMMLSPGLLRSLGQTVKSD